MRQLAPLLACLALSLVPTNFVPPVFAQSGEDDIVTKDPRAAAEKQAKFIRRARQLTYEGRRAGEGYFGADDRTMVFQSERYEQNPFFQIYVLNRDTAETQLVSPGTGKTTCAWLHPDGQRVMFSSTHEDPKSRDKQKATQEQRASGNEPRYSFTHDAEYDIYETVIGSGEYRNLTNTLGYDAEGSYSPDGKQIAFASNRAIFETKLSAEDQELFDRDPAWGNDIYVMNVDGTNVRRLTTARGYDGGPFFSPDGKEICFRRFSEDGATAEIMTIAIDGTNERQLTNMGVMSWAPFYHPSGEYLIFNTNLHGFANFELYIVDRLGKRKPQRISYSPSFDGLAAFTPNGDEIAWTANRTTNGKGQIFIGDWNHREALRVLELKQPEPGTSKQMVRNETSGRAPSRRSQFAPADAVQHVEYLCRPQLKGRLTGTKGERLATNYVALNFETLGLEPAGDDESWFQSFEFTSGVSAGENNQLKAAETSYEIQTDWRPLSFSKSGQFDESDVVFAGYGLQAPAAEGIDEYDSFVHLDVKDKWVMCFRFMPEEVAPKVRQHWNKYSSLRFKAMKARELGARGLIVVSGPTSGVSKQLVPLRFDGSLAGSSVAVISVTDKVADSWLKAAGKNLGELQKKLDNGDPAMGFPIKGASLSATIDVTQEKKTGRNVLGRFIAGEEPSQEVIVVGAHIDHLGAGPNANSLAKDSESDSIHYGADDNASGVSAMLQMAEALSNAKEAGKLKGDRDVIFAAWSGEELGLLGSSHYVSELENMFSQHASALGADADEEEQADTPKAGEVSSGPNTGGLHLYIAACLNMDMVGRMQEKLVLQGIGSSPEWTRIIERANLNLGLPVSLQEDCYLPTDASVFFLHGVPILSAFTGNHSEYHTPRDTPEKLNYEGISQVAELMHSVVVQLMTQKRSPSYTMQDRPKDEQRKASLRAYLGTIPDYAQSDVTGVLLSGVAKNGPTSKAGVKGGDVIVSLAGKKIENIYDYTYAIEALKIGQTVEIEVDRSGKRLKMKVTPESRQ